MAARLLILLYAFVAYTAFFVSSNYAVGFIGNYWVPKSIDLGSAADPREAVIVDLLLLGAFAIQHSVMARPAFKHWWTKIIPPVIERSTYVLCASLALLNEVGCRCPRCSATRRPWSAATSQSRRFPSLPRM